MPALVSTPLSEAVEVSRTRYCRMASPSASETVNKFDSSTELPAVRLALVRVVAATVGAALPAVPETVRL